MAREARSRRRYSDEDLLAELTACARRLRRSPTMREFSDDPRARPHPQTVVERFGTWNDAKRRAGLVPRRFATKDELLLQLRRLGDELGRTPTGRDLDARRAALPSKSLYWHSFGSLSNALRAAGFDVPHREERRERALAQGERLAVEPRPPPALRRLGAGSPQRPGDALGVAGLPALRRRARGVDELSRGAGSAPRAERGGGEP